MTRMARKSVPAVSRPEAVGTALRQARLECGLTTRVVARQLTLLGIPVSHATVANHERGRTIPSQVVLVALARVYDRSYESLLSMRPAFDSLPRFRCLTSARKSQQDDLCARALPWLVAYQFVEDLGVDDLEYLKPIQVSPSMSGQELAELVRGNLGIGDYPLPSVVRLLENYEVHTIDLEADPGISAFAATLSKRPVVVLNSGLSPDRMRLTAAHELAHHLFSDCLRDRQIDDRTVEKRAFEFASHLLFPEASLDDAFALKSMVRLVQYKERFGISLAAMIYRAKQSRLINQRTYQRLWMDFAKLGWRRDEPGNVTPDRPRRMEALFDGAVRQKRTDFASIAQAAGRDETAVRQRVLRAMGATETEEPVADFTSPLRFTSHLPDVEKDWKK